MRLPELRAAIEQAGCEVSKADDRSFRSKCPVCRTSRNDKLSVTDEDGQILVKCFGECQTEDIVAAIGLQMRDLFTDEQVIGTNQQTKIHTTLDDAISALQWGIRRQHSDAREVGRWSYATPDGKPHACVIRFTYTTEKGQQDKTYRQCHHVAGGWITKAPKHRFLYRVDELIDVDEIWVFEGEKCADCARDIGLAATTTIGGCKQVAKSDFTPFNGKRLVVLCPDSGPDGERWLNDCAKMIRALHNPPEIKICDLGFRDETNADIVDWMEGIATEDEAGIRASLAMRCAPLAITTERNEPDERTKAPGLRRISYRIASDIQSESVDWLWYGYIPATGITFLDGDPEAGKTCCALDIIARITKGMPMPGEVAFGDQQPRDPENVSILAKEDRYENTIKPRLEAAGADMMRIACIDHVELDLGDRVKREFLTLPAHTGEVAEHLREFKTKLLLIDPYDNHLDDGLNTSKSTDMRKAFTPLTEAAADLGCAVLIIRHFGKKEYENAKHKGLGSIALTGMARSNLAAVDDGAGGYIFGRIKGNLSRQPDSLIYQIRSWDQDPEVPQLHWCGLADQSVSEAAVRGNDRQTKTDRLGELLEDLLGDGPKDEPLVLAAVKAAGISVSLYKRKRKEFGVTSKKTGMEGGWQLHMERSD